MHRLTGVLRPTIATRYFGLAGLDGMPADSFEPPQPILNVDQPAMFRGKVEGVVIGNVVQLRSQNTEDV